MFVEIKGTKIPDESSPFRAEFLEQLKELGFANVTDEVAITTKTTEKLILIMAGLQFHHRIALSYGKSRFKMCFQIFFPPLGEFIRVWFLSF